MATNISWTDKVTNTQLYRGMPKITEVIKQRRLRLAGYSISHTDEIAHNLVVWQPNNGIRNRGRQHKTYIDILKIDCSCEEDELITLMIDREGWKATARFDRVRTRLKQINNIMPPNIQLYITIILIIN